MLKKKLPTFDIMILSKPSLTFLFVFVTYLASSQVPVGFTIMDENTTEKIKYCLVKSNISGGSYLSNANGWVHIHTPIEKDTLTFEYPGYQPTRKPILEIKDSSVIFINSDDTIAQNIYSNLSQSSLHEYIIKGSQQLFKKPVIASKSYLDFYSMTDGKDTEMSRFYYNTQIQGSKILNMSFKQGRVALIPQTNGLAGLNPSLALIKYSPVHDSRTLPKNPLQQDLAERMGDLWDFTVLPATIDDDALSISFTPKNTEDGNLFGGEILINVSTYDIKYISLHIPTAHTHPFVTVADDTIMDVSLDLKYFFTTESNGTDQMAYAVYYYSFDYFADKSKLYIKKRIFTEGIFHLYGDKTSFFIPKLRYAQPFDDYIKSALYPSHDDFWDENDRLMVTDQQIQKLPAFASKGVMYNYFDSNDEIIIKNKIISEFSIIWNKDNFLNLRQNVISDTIVTDLSVDIFLNIDTYNGQTIFNTMTVLDYLHTNYSLEYNTQNLVYQNIYFDLCEIVRLNLNETLKGLKAAEDMNMAHEAALKDLESVTTKYKSETNKGSDIHQLKKWNDLVLQRTGVDNFQSFKLRYKPKKRKR